MSLKISLLSQNGLSHNFEKSDEIIDINNFNPDIFVEMTQEDGRRPEFNVDGQLLQFSTPMLYENPLVSSLHNSFNKFNVVLKIYSKKGIKVTQLEHGKIKLQSRDGVFWSFISNFITTKGAVYTKILVDGKQILFVNMHLASNIGEMGNKIRKKCLISVIKQLIKKNILDTDTTLIIGGDLNFRIESGIKLDQLTEFLKTLNYSNSIQNRRLSEFAFKNEDDKKFTCKFRDIRKTAYKDFKNYSNCRIRKEPESIDNREELTDEDSKSIDRIQSECGVHDRYPSRCDRFLYSLGKDQDIEFEKYTGIYLPSVGSDHNAIYANLILDPEHKGGKKIIINSKIKTNKRKQIKNKTKKYRQVYLRH